MRERRTLLESHLRALTSRTTRDELCHPHSLPALIDEFLLSHSHNISATSYRYRFTVIEVSVRMVTESPCGTRRSELYEALRASLQTKASVLSWCLLVLRL